MLAAVELKDFVRQTLDIAAGLHEANETYKASQISACGTPGSASNLVLSTMLTTRLERGGVCRPRRVQPGARPAERDQARRLVQLGP